MKNIYLFCSLLLISFTSTAQLTTVQEGFESWPPTNWGIYELGVALDGWRDDFDGIFHSGAHSAYSSIDNNQSDNWLVSPQIEIVNGDYDFKFWAYSRDIQFIDRASVHVSTGSGDPASGDFVEVFFTPPSTPNEIWEETIIDLSSYVGQNIYVAFRHEGTFHRWYIDDVSVTPNAFTDGALTQVINPLGVSENPSVEDIIVTLKNEGTSTIDDLAIDWSVNGNAQTQFTVNLLNLAPGASTNLTIGNFNFDTMGLYSLEAILDIAGDFDPSNNNLNWTYTVSSIKDGALVALSPEGITPVSGMQDIIVTIQNVGENTIDIVEIIWEVDGVSQAPYNNGSMNILPGTSMSVVIGQYDFATSGVYQIEATLLAVGDVNVENDTYLATTAINTFYESFEGAQFPPEHWSITFGTLENSNFGNPVEGDKYYGASPDQNFFGTVSDTIYSPRLEIEAGDTYSFYIKPSAFLAANNELVWKDGVTGDVTVIQTINAPDNTWTQVTLDISAAQGNNYIGITSVVPDSAPGFTEYDLFTSTANIHLYDQDLEIKNGDIYFLAGDNVNEGFDVLIKNTGVLPVLGSNYTVRLMEAPGTVVATANGVNLDSWEEAVVTVNHTFSGIASHRLYFEIDFAQDEELENNTFREVDVHVVPGSVVLDEMGTKDGIDLNFPFNTGGDTFTVGDEDISQTLYLNSDFDNPGDIYGFVYAYDNLLASDRVQELPLKVWISQTQTDDLSSGYLPNSELVLVFDGIVEILPGPNRELYIPFDQPISYTGIDNIVVQDYQFDPEWWPSISRFYATANAGPNIRTIRNFDLVEVDLMNPPTSFYSTSNFVYTRFVVDPQISTSLVSGTVRDDSNNPLENATVTIDGSTISAQTDGNGEYQLVALPYGTYDISASKFGYNDQTIVTTLNTANTTQDFVLSEKAIVQINGRVVGSNDTNIPLENVEIVMDGYTTDTTSTDNLGEFNFPTVYGDNEYELTFSLYGYNEKIVMVTVVDATIELGDIVLDQDFISPFDVTVMNDTEVTIEWKDPLLSSKVKLQNDFDVNSFSYTNEPNENVWLGNLFTINEITTLTSVEIRTDIFALAADFVSIDVFDVATEEIIASSELFLLERDALINIDIPNIVVYEDIMVAVHWQNNPESTYALVTDFSDPSIPNTAVIKYPGGPITLLSDAIGAFESSFHVRINTLDDGTPITNNEVLSYNVLRGLASEFPDISNWELLNSSPIIDNTYVDVDWSSTISTEQYRFAVETVYREELSEVTFSNVIDGAVLGISQFDLDNLISVYPVPANNEINIYGNNLIEENTSIQIFDVLGRQIDQFNAEVGDGVITKSTAFYDEGIYFLRLNVNSKTVNKKFVVKH
jgi:hypothetical protein